MEITKYGIYTIRVGEPYYNLPEWGKDIENRATKNIIDAGDNNFYSLPLSDININQLIQDIQYYMECSNIIMAEKEEEKLRFALRQKTVKSLEDNHNDQ